MSAFYELRCNRLEKGLSIAAYAQQWGLTPSTYRRIEAGGSISGVSFAKMMRSVSLDCQIATFEQMLELCVTDDQKEHIPKIEKLLTMLREEAAGESHL